MNHKRNKYQKRINIQLTVAVMLCLAGLSLLFMGFWCSPTGEIHNSVLIGFGEVSTFAGALFGVDYKYKEKRTYFISCDRPNHHPSIFQKVERLMPQHPDSALAQKQWEQAALLSKRYELSHDSIEKARLEQELETEKNKCRTLSKRKDVLTYVM